MSIALSVSVLCASVLGYAATGRPTPPAQPTNPVEARPVSPDHQARGDSVDDLSEHTNDGAVTAAPIPLRPHQRQALLDERRRLRGERDVSGLARLNSVLASEAFSRAARLTVRWLDRRDPRSGLFPARLRPDRPDSRHWTYGDAGADLFPFLTVATRYLIPERYPELLANLAAERALSPGLPRDVSLDTGQGVEQEAEKRLLGAVEYAKDGLLPLVEALGPDPWLLRLREVTDQVIAASATPTPLGPIPANSTEVNGSALQVLARLYWLTRDPRYLEMGNRISAAYLDYALPTTEHLPPHRWNFVENEPIGPRRFYLGDHGNEIVSGLVEWQRVEALTGSPTRQDHRSDIRKMLDRLLAKGRTPDGLWYEIIDVPSGQVRDRDLSDNWGYLGQAYLNHADLERTSADGDRAIAERFERAAATMLRAVSTVDFYAWENGDMDGYADTLEGAIYLLRYLDEPKAAEWVDEQIAVLYGYQHADGSVTDESIDGNFIRTVMLYGLSMTEGVRLEPWTDGVSVGATRDGNCIQVHVHAEAAWAGHLVFDTPRYRLGLGLPTDYPRLNQWPERFVADLGRSYTVVDVEGGSRRQTGGELAAGIPLMLAPDRDYQLRACPDSVRGV